MLANRRQTLAWSGAAVIMVLIVAIAFRNAGGTFALRGEQVQLADAAEEFIVRVDDAYVDALLLLDEAQPTPGSSCSDDELDRLRRLMVATPNVAGVFQRVGEDRYCTTLGGSLSAVGPTGAPHLVMPDGVSWFASQPFPPDPERSTVMIARGDAGVIINPLALRAAGLPQLQDLVLNADGEFIHLLGTKGEVVDLPYAIEGQTLSAATGAVVADGWLAVAACSPAGLCAIFADSVADAVSREWRVTAAFTAAGALVGGLITVCLFLFWQWWTSPLQRLSRALASGHLTVVYQPKVDLATRRISGAEALLRWPNQKPPALSPDQFIALAEANGDMKALTTFVTRQALGECKRLLHDHPDFQLAVNISAEDLDDPEFPDRIGEQVKKANVTTHQLSLEITERAAVKTPDAVAALRARGHEIALDDFGTGYSSFAVLEHLPLDAMKIDKALVRTVEDSERSVWVLNWLCNLAQKLSLKVIVEGLETEEQARIVTSAGASVGQGYYFSKPVPVETLSSLVNQERPA